MGFGVRMINMSVSAPRVPALQPGTSGLVSLNLSFNICKMETKMQTVGWLVGSNKKTYKISSIINNTW